MTEAAPAAKERFRWYRDPATIWSLGRVVPRAEYGDSPPPPGHVLLATNAGDGPRKSFKESETFIHNATHTDPELDDVANMDDIHEAPLLNLLRRRYAENTIYTFTSEMVVSINPYKTIPGLYDIDHFRREMGKHADDELHVAGTSDATSRAPPHLFTVAHRAHQDLIGGQNQSILMSGESGAGKTEASKYVLRYLVTSSAQHRLDDGVGERVEQSLIKSIPLLETFGNALTINNDNSSRFGKFMKIDYHADGRIYGGRQETFLLEKSRLVHQERGEANFHIFYHLLSGASDAERASLFLDHEFNYVVNGVDTAGTGDLHTLDEVKAEMLGMGFDQAGVDAVMECVAGVLHLGNIEFVGTAEDDTLAAVSPESDPSVAAVSKLLGLSSGLLRSALTSRTFSIDAGRQATETRVPLTLKQAASNRDALAKELYARLFSAVVQQVNQSTNDEAGEGAAQGAALAAGASATPSAGGAGAGAGAGADAGDVRARAARNERRRMTSAGNRFVGILDIFGFEVEEENGFSQLCINYANEMLQSLYNSHVFVLEQLEYDAEGITWDTMAFQDNKEVLELMAAKRTGLFVSLDEQAMLGDRASDENWLGVISQAHLGKSRRFGRPKIAPEDKFTITHYASAVTYHATGCVARNNDSLERDLSNLARSSESDFVANLFGGRPALPTPPGGDADGDGGTDATATPRSRKFAGSVTVSRQFRSQMNALMGQLDMTRPQFIRCLKPNGNKRADSFDAQLCLHQLKYLGVFETVRIRQSGYPVRRPFADMARQCLQLYRGSISDARTRLETDPRGLCEELMTQALGTADSSGVAAFQMGKTKVFLRQGKLEELDQVMQRRLAANAVLIQKIFKGRRARNEYKEKLSRLMLLQIWIIMMRLRRRKRKAAIKLQKGARRFTKRRQYLKQQRGATLLAARHKSNKARRQYSRQVAATKSINRVMRGFIDRERAKRYLGAIVKLQAMQRRRRFRGRHVNVLRSRKKWRDILHSGEAVLLQSLVRKQRAKAGMFKVDRQRQLILTTQPRLIYLDPTVKNVKAAIKGVIPFDDNLKAAAKDERTFSLTHSGEDGTARTMMLTDLLGSADRWVSAITKAQTAPTSVKDLYYGGLPEEFEMQGHLHKKKRTKSGWNQKFFVVRGNSITWFSNEHSTTAKDVFEIHADTSVEDHALKPNGFSVVNSDGSSLVLAAPGPEDLEAWKLCIRQLVNKLKAEAGGGEAGGSGAGSGAGAGSR